MVWLADWLVLGVNGWLQRELPVTVGGCLVGKLGGGCAGEVDDWPCEDGRCGEENVVRWCVGRGQTM